MYKYAGILFILSIFAVINYSVGVVFYEHINFQGNYYRAPPGWASKYCVNVPNWINDRASSVNTEDKCIQVFEHADCRGQSAHIFPGSSGHSFLGRVGMNDIITSYKGC